MLNGKSVMKPNDGSLLQNSIFKLNVLIHSYIISSLSYSSYFYSDWVGIVLVLWFGLVQK